MKKKALIAAVLAATTLTATTAFAAQNPFKDLPEGHWAYDAVTMLAQDGVIDGYGDGNFNGNKLMNRYEMAEIVSKAMAKYDGARPQDKGAIKKLEKEFGAELKDMDVRLKGVEEDVKELKKGQSSFKWYGDARMRFFQNKDNKMTHPNTYWGSAQNGKESQIEKRVRLGVYGEPAKNLVVDARLKYEDSSFVHGGAQYSSTDPNNANFNTWDSSYRNQNSVRLDKASLIWNNAGTKLAVGRNEFNLGQGILWWENSMDGAYIAHQFGKKVNVMAGWGDMAAEGWQDKNMPAWFSNVTVTTSPATTFTVASLHTNTALQGYSATGGTPKENWYQKSDGSWASYMTPTGAWKDKDYKFNQIAVGMNTQLANKWNLIAEGVHNNIAGDKLDKNGFWARLTYGKMQWNKANTWKVYAEYFALGNASIDSVFWGHRLNIAGGNSSFKGGDNRWGNGDRGWGLAADYMLAANTNIEVAYYKLKPFDKNYGASDYGVFNRYDDVLLGALTFSF
jgi:hypothetical protein